jgi:hypothetical protein
VKPLDPSPWYIRITPSFAVAGVTALALFLAAPHLWIPAFKLTLAYLVTPIAKELWLCLGTSQFGLPRPLTALLLILINLSFSLFFALAIPVESLVRKLPRIGRKIARFEERVHGNRYAQRGLSLALFVVVALPIHSGGAILGSLGGRALGLTWWRTVLAVAGANAARVIAAYVIVLGYVGLDLPGC